MDKPFIIIVKYKDQVFSIDGDALELVDPQSDQPFDKGAIARANNWEMGLLAGLQAAIGYKDEDELEGDLQQAQDSQDG